MSIEEIPLTAENQLFTIQLGGQKLRLRLIFRDSGGWILDLLNLDDTPLVTGIPLVQGADLLESHSGLGFSGGLWVVSDDEAHEYPTKANLGTLSHLYFVSRY